MAQSGYTPIALYHSTTPGTTPAAGDLQDGELALNIADGYLFFKRSGIVQNLAGLSGYSGISGYSGFSGISGFSGRSGFSGFSGVGLSGFSGFSGFSGAPPSGVNLGNWTITASGSKLFFAFNSVNLFSLDTSGNFVATNNITAYDTP